MQTGESVTWACMTLGVDAHDAAPMAPDGVAAKIGVPRTRIERLAREATPITAAASLGVRGARHVPSLTENLNFTDDRAVLVCHDDGRVRRAFAYSRQQPRQPPCFQSRRGVIGKLNADMVGDEPVVAKIEEVAGHASPITSGGVDFQSDRRSELAGRAIEAAERALTVERWKNANQRHWCLALGTHHQRHWRGLLRVQDTRVLHGLPSFLGPCHAGNAARRFRFTTIDCASHLFCARYHSQMRRPPGRSTLLFSRPAHGLIGTLPHRLIGRWRLLRDDCCRRPVFPFDVRDRRLRALGC